MKWHVWMEGAHPQEGVILAQYHGEFEGETFADACLAWNATQSPDLQRYYGEHLGRPAWWGCRLFDNEADARQAFG